MSQGAFMMHQPGGLRGLLLVVGAWMLQGGFVGALAAPTSIRSEIHRREIQSSGAVSEVSASPDNKAAAADSSTTSEVWPEAATAKGEVSLGYLHGGTRPQKVQIGSNVFVRKKVLEGDSQAIMMEALANELYKAAGVKSEHCRYYPAVAKLTTDSALPKKHSRVNGPAAYMLCRFIDGLQPVFAFTDEVKKAVSKNFVLDAIFGAYDVGGMFAEGHPRGNVGWDSDKNMVRIDSGGALAADGLGDWKPTEYKCKDRLFNRHTTWSPEPFQLWDFQITSEIYHRLSKGDLVAQAKEVVAKSKDILAAVDNFQSGAAAARVKGTLQARLECLGRIANDRPDLFESKLMQAKGFNQELPSAICDGVRALCADLSEAKTHSSP